ncbi:GerMN domain-containing protein [Alkalicoccus chagannorensis]|uniref:GerMN domain-containing protein n=1 Tax=Alkalicoccus chagannorensis TaxID=427072 RepID=UPI00040D4EBC|nr:GerMN domain-containing protein [Alkalicoccus chagannorensis]
MKRTAFVLFSAASITALTACGQGEEENLTDNANVGGADEVEEDPSEDNNENDENEPNNNNDDNVNNNDNGEEDNEELSTSNTENDADNQENNNAMNLNDNNETDEADLGSNNNNNVNNTENDTDNNNETNEGTEDQEADVLDSLYLYFADDQLLDTFRVASDHSVTMDDAGAAEAMELWEAGPEQDGLYGLLPEGSSVQSVELDDSLATVSLSGETEEANLGSSGEAMLTEQIAMMMEQFGADETMILIDGEETDNFLGHMDLSEPVQAGSPEDYDLYE